MPFRSFSELEQFKLIGKEADSQGLLGIKITFSAGGNPVCWLGHAGAFMDVSLGGGWHATEEVCGALWGLDRNEVERIIIANDHTAGAAGRVERVCAAVDEIGVG